VSIQIEALPQAMYNLTVAEVHTFIVGEGAWVVHNEENRLPIDIIRFTQSSYGMAGRKPGGFYNVLANTMFLVNNPSLDLQHGDPIRVFRMTEELLNLGPVVKPGNPNIVGNPFNLQVGEIYTLDNRRLATYRNAGRSDMPVRWATNQEIQDEMWKATTPNYGRDALPHPPTDEYSEWHSRERANDLPSGC
jgi:hypothetical protein